MKNVLVLALAVAVFSPALLDAQACRGFATNHTTVAPTMLRGDWAGTAGVTFDAYGGVVSRPLSDRYNAGFSGYGATVFAMDGTEPTAWAGEALVSRSMVDSYLNQQVVCLNAGIAAQGVDQDDVEFAVPASLSFGVEMDGGRFSLTPHGLVGARFVLDDGVDPRLDVGFGLALRFGPVVTGAALYKQGHRDQQRGVLHAGIRF
jgi:hypothetical protein